MLLCCAMYFFLSWCIVLSVMHCCVFFALHVAACIGSMVFEIYFRKLNTMLIFFIKRVLASSTI